MVTVLQALVMVAREFLAMDVTCNLYKLKSFSFCFSKFCNFSTFFYTFFSQKNVFLGGFHSHDHLRSYSIRYSRASYSAHSKTGTIAIYCSNTIDVTYLYVDFQRCCTKCLNVCIVAATELIFLLHT